MYPLLGAHVQVKQLPEEDRRHHAGLVAEFANATHWPKHLLVHYRWQVQHEVDEDRGLTLLFAAGAWAWVCGSGCVGRWWWMSSRVQGTACGGIVHAAARRRSCMGVAVQGCGICRQKCGRGAAGTASASQRKAAPFASSLERTNTSPAPPPLCSNRG